MPRDRGDETRVPTKRSWWTPIAALALVIALMGGFIVVRLTAAPPDGLPADSAGANATTVDAVSAYHAAIASGRPVYVLFHSLS
jgi:hypothetical protein